MPTTNSGATEQPRILRFFDRTIALGSNAPELLARLYRHLVVVWAGEAGHGKSTPALELARLAAFPHAAGREWCVGQPSA
jgi:hypothetical protein